LPDDENFFPELGIKLLNFLINGAPIACITLATGTQPPFNGVSVMDASNDGWGGLVGFDNIDVTAP